MLVLADAALSWAGGREVSAAEADVASLVARELHDSVAQTLTTMIVQMEIFKAEQRGRDSVQRNVDLFQGSVREVLDQVRQLLYDLRGEPAIETDLVATLRHSLLPQFQQRTGIATAISVARDWPRRLPPHVALNLYRILQESLRNVAHHSGATRVRVRLQMATRGPELIVTDNGRGLAEEFDAGPPGLGVLGMRERALLLGGEVTIRTVPPSGVEVRGIFPMPALRGQAGIWGPAQVETS